VKLSGVFVSLVSTSLNPDSESACQDVVLNVLHQDVFSGQEFFLANLKKTRTYQPTETPIDDIVQLYVT
jgi:hypothetical protein